MVAVQDPYAEQKTSEVLSGLGQRLVPLSHDSKNKLLADATRIIYSDAGKTQAAGILARLKELDPELAPQFHPKRDALDNVLLRMICSNPGPAQVEHVPSYIAVSYC
jgi:hypothetical protein